MKVTETPAADWWITELARAIDEAQWLAWRIGVLEGPNMVALDLYVRLECARAELESLRSAKFG